MVSDLRIPLIVAIWRAVSPLKFLWFISSAVHLRAICLDNSSFELKIANWRGEFPNFDSPTARTCWCWSISSKSKIENYFKNTAVTILLPLTTFLACFETAIWSAFIPESSTRTSSSLNEPNTEFIRARTVFKQAVSSRITAAWRAVRPYKNVKIVQGSISQIYVSKNLCSSCCQPFLSNIIFRWITKAFFE